MPNVPQHGTPDMLTVEEFARDVGLSQSTIRNYIRENKIRTTRLGKRLIRINVAEKEKITSGELVEIPASRGTSVQNQAE